MLGAAGARLYLVRRRLLPGGEVLQECRAPLANDAVANSPRAYTPPHLVAKILATRKALEGERKQVTVLFADLKGSMDLSEEIDPEQWTKITLDAEMDLHLRTLEPYPATLGELRRLGHLGHASRPA
jgi:hypothetical protein